MARSIVWFRRDLRLHDHPALAAALAEGEVLPLFVVDPAFEAAGPGRRALLHDCLVALRGATGGALVVRSGLPSAVVPAVAAEVDAATVFVSKDFAPLGRRRDAEVADALRAAGRTLRGVGSPYAVEPGRVTKDDGSPYAVFTPFSRRWRAHGRDEPLPAPADANWIELAGPGDAGLPTRPALPFDIGAVTEAAVLDRWRGFREQKADTYHDGRNLPAERGTSELSPFLKYGVVHPRQLLAELDVSARGHAVFASELAWREFYADVLFHRPRSARENLDGRFDALPVDTGRAAEARFAAWREGRTGFPFVDAGMRQLAATGWMHNRLRMVVASFLVKDLHLPWQWGARHFMQLLLDGDLASNSHGWQWTAGCGTDAAPYFRVFNPAAQQERYDPDGVYVGTWIPELGTPGYPAPIVEHAVERADALARYEAVKAAARE